MNKKMNNPGIFRRILSYTKNYKFETFSIIIFAVLGAATTVAGPKISGLAIDSLSRIVSGQSDFSEISKMVIVLLAIYSLYALSMCLVNYFSNNISARISYEIRQDVCHKLSSISLKYVEDSSPGDILSRVVNDIDIFTDLFSKGIRQSISSSIISVGVLVMMFTISAKIAAISLVMFALMGVFVAVMVKRSQKYYKKYQEGLGKLNNCISEAFKGHEVVKVFGSEIYIMKKFDDLNSGMYESAWKSQFISGIMMPVMDILNNINYIMVCVLGGYMVITQSLSIGDISAFIAYLSQVFHPLSQLAGLSGMFQQSAVAANRIFEILDAPVEQNCNKLCEDQHNLKFCDKIEFKNISFGYDDANDILKDFSFTIPKGSVVALVGKTGAGKTTLIKLLMKFYQIRSGEILIDGRNINDINIQEYRQLFGLVSQDAWLYSDTIMENIRYGKRNASDEEVKEAARFVGADHFIESLPQGYETLISEDSENLSEGQKQLITLARLALSDSQILIMDEATASIDSGTEEKIQKSLKKLFSLKTAVVVAHRLSTIKNADTIIVLGDGQIKEKGNHKALLERRGSYYQLYMSQFSESN